MGIDDDLTRVRPSLTAVVASMIPGSDEYGVPGADDPAILAEIMASARPHAEAVVAGLGQLDALARERFDRRLPALGAEDIETLVDDFRTLHPDATKLLVRLTVQCYYRDERVMRALGLDVRPPYPRGHDVPPGDWSLLDPVRRRPKLYREPPTTR